jgi:microcystin degradation protein MlrC
MRVAIGGIDHEASTYAAGLTRIGDFGVLRGDETLATRDQETRCGGAVQGRELRRVTPVPVLQSGAQPSGTHRRGCWT